MTYPSTHTSPIPFAGGVMDHAEPARSPEELQSYIQNPASRVVMFISGNPAVGPDGKLVLCHPTDLIGKNLIEPGPIFLGISKGTPYFSAGLESADTLAPAESFQQIRMIANHMQLDELAIAGRAKSMLDWHVEHRFCAKCGDKSLPHQGGMLRYCPKCETQHFPRVNPVAIMMVLHEDHCLLGRSAGWPPGAFSALAGFISPGETLEEGCQREVFEEVGLKVDTVRYIMSQPWPFPSQLMMGLTCHARDRELTINKAEIEDAQWFSKQTVKAVYAKKSDAFMRPPRMAIAHHLIKHWLDE